jgi:hypothetical protein
MTLVTLAASAACIFRPHLPFAPCHQGGCCANLLESASIAIPMPQFFICYRRSDSAGHAGRLYDRLIEHFPEDGVFIDLESIAPAAHFPTRLQNALSASKVLLVVIGKSWTTASDNGKRRLDDPEDWVRREVELGLELKGVHVVAVLVDGAGMPREDELPAELRPLLKYQKYTLSNDKFGREVDELVGLLQKAGHLQRGDPPVRRRLVSALMEAGPPWSWLGWAVNRLSPGGASAAAFASLALLVLAAIWATHLYEAGSRSAEQEESNRAEIENDRLCTKESLVIDGSVWAPDLKVIKKASVSLELTDPPRMLPPVNTDKFGKYGFNLTTLVPPPRRGHNMFLRVQAPGYELFEKRFTCGQLAPDFVLSKSGSSPKGD